jgi:hypothetical protein
MNNSIADDPIAGLRHAVYWLLIIAAAGGMVGRILNVQSRDGSTPFLSANDRSRWCTIRALVDEGTYSIDNVVIDPQSKKIDRRWYTIDMVRHKGHDGKEHYYSSKPTLLPTLLAAQYWLFKKLIGAGLQDHPFYIGRSMLIITNVLPMILYFALLAHLVERYGTTSRGRILVMACATWGTFLTTFAVTLNNHLPAAISVLMALAAALAIWCDGRRNLWYFAAAGLLSAFAAANELPALSFFAAIGAALLWKSPGRTLLAFVPAAGLVAAGFFATNYLAHDSWRTPYAHRQDGQLLLTLDADLQNQLEQGIVPEPLRQRLRSEVGIDLSASAVVASKTSGNRWVLWDKQGQDRLALVLDDDTIRVHAWDNWYEYERSYWTSGQKSGVDLGEPSRGVYAFNLLIGHHGIFSLTPIWLLSVVGMGMLSFSRQNHNLRGVGLLAGLLTVVCLGFYITRPLEDRNYGGVASGLRWLFWLTPLWLLCMLPVADAIARNRWGFALGLLLFAVSVISATYSGLNPWSHPWIFDYWRYLDWIEY